MDLSFLRKLMDGDEALVDRFVSIFKAQVPGQVAALAALYNSGEWEELSTALHSLKTQFNYVGMSEFATQMQTMEAEVDAGNTAALQDEIHLFTAQFENFWESQFSAA
jgi:HPt (histidine-containing phosphotransfer) domain-containing protein